MGKHRTAWEIFLDLEEQLNEQKDKVRAELTRSRLAKGWTLAELARRAKTNHGGILQLFYTEPHRKKWNAIVAQKVARALGMPAGPRRPPKLGRWDGVRPPWPEIVKRNALIVRLAKKGWTAPQIADHPRINRTPKYVYQLLTRFRKEGLL